MHPDTAMNTCPIIPPGTERFITASASPTWEKSIVPASMARLPLLDHALAGRALGRWRGCLSRRPWSWGPSRSRRSLLLSNFSSWTLLLLSISSRRPARSSSFSSGRLSLYDHEEDPFLLFPFPFPPPDPLSWWPRREECQESSFFCGCFPWLPLGSSGLWCFFLLFLGFPFGSFDLPVLPHDPCLLSDSASLPFWL